MDIKVSVIVPMYNVEDYIKETLDSILSQDIDEIEILVIDDGSSDESPNIVKEYAKKHTEVKYIFQENSGPSIARNRGIELARGEFIIFVDSDDILPKNSIKLRYETAKEKNCDIVVCGTYKFDGKSTWMMEKHFLSPGYKDIKVDYDLLWTLGPCNKIYRRETIKDIKFLENIKYAEDQVFVLDAYLKARKIYAIQEVGYYYRVRENETESLTQQIYSNSLNVLEQVKDSWLASKKNIEDNVKNPYLSNDLQEAYFARLISIDIWAPLKNIIISRKEDSQIEGFKRFEDILSTITDDQFNSNNTLKWIIFKGVIDKYLFLGKKARKEYLKVLKRLYKRMSNESIYDFNDRYDNYLNMINRAIKTNSNIPIFIFLTNRNLRKPDNKVKRVLGSIVFKVSKIIPINKNKVIFASNKSNELSGNLKCIYEEIQKQNLDYKIKFYFRNYDRKLINEIKMYYNLATAKYVILDDYYRQIYGKKFKKDVEVIQVWHACGAFKKFGFSSIGKNDSNTKEFEAAAHGSYTKVITSSKEINKHYSEAFNIDESNVYALGVPRTDILLNNQYKEYIKNVFEGEYPQLKGKKVITYAPTFRGTPAERKNFKLKLDLEKLLSQIGTDYIFVLKLHPSVQFGISGELKLSNKIKNRVLILDSSIDINDVLLLSDIVISDYSSVIFEGALLEKNIIMYAYDKDEYLKERDFYYDYESFVPGPIAEKTEDIIEIIKNNKFDKEKVIDFKNRFFDDADGKASERFVRNIFKK